MPVIPSTDNIISGGTPPQLQLIQKNLPLTNGHGYTLVFDARSIPGVRDIQVRFTSTNSPGQIQYFQNNAVPLSPSMSTYTVTFTMLDPTDPYARVVARRIRWSDKMFSYRIGDPAADLSFRQRCYALQSARCRWV